MIFIFCAAVAFAAIPDGYYDGTSGLSGESLKQALHQIIDDHIEYFYSFLWESLIVTDEDPDNSSNFVLIYTGRSLPKTATYPEWNREHTWPKSHGDFGETPPAGTDMHHLRPTDVSVNSDRGNKDFDNGGTAHSEAIGCYYDSDSWEPRDEVKGDVARMMFYMEVRYEGDSGEPDLELVDYTGTSGPNLGKLSTLLEWHAQDPISDFERTRNERIYGYQNNRNPFVDRPEFVAYIWGGESPGTLEAPLALDATEIDSLSFIANWTAVNTAAAYHLYVAGDENFERPLRAYNPRSVSGTSELIGSLQPGTDYYYKVKALNDSLESPFSNVIAVRTLTNSTEPGDTLYVHSENFDNFPESGSSYQNGTFTGDDGSIWTYQQCRGDISIDGKSPCMAKTSQEASVTSGTIGGGISNLSFQYMQAFSSDVSLDLYVNDQFIRTFTTSSEQNVVKGSGPVAVNIEGDVVIRLTQNNSASGQVAVDNISWDSYQESALQILPEDFTVSPAYPNPFNPECKVALLLRRPAQVRANLYDSRGKFRKQIFSGHMSTGEQELQIQAGELPSGVYMLHLRAGNSQIIRKLLLIK